MVEVEANKPILGCSSKSINQPKSYHNYYSLLVLKIIYRINYLNNIKLLVTIFPKFQEDTKEQWKFCLSHVNNATW